MKTLKLHNENFQGLRKQELIDVISYSILEVARLMKVNRNKQWLTGKRKTYRILEGSLYYISLKRIGEKEIELCFEPFNVSSSISHFQSEKIVETNLSIDAIEKDFPKIKQNLEKQWKNKHVNA